MPNPSRFAAIDTDVLLSLSAGDEQCQEAIDVLNNAGFYFIVTETPLQELADICQNEGNEVGVRGAATLTLAQLTNFGFITPTLDPVQMGVAEQVARRIIDKCLPDCEINDGLVITEAAYNNCKLMISKREDLLTDSRIQVSALLVDSDLSAVIVLSPEEVIELFNSGNE